jgi:putative membrane protein insertion efficiency factor
VTARGVLERWEGAVRAGAWVAGWPVRALLIAAIRAYRVTLGPVLGGRCRFHPSCSAYAEAAIRELGWVRGTVLAAWRVLRCSPLTAGGVDYPPARSYDNVLQARARGRARQR